MAHFAELNESNVVRQVLVVDNADIMDGDTESESVGQAFLEDLLPGSGPWVQTSYNTRHGVHQHDGTPFRGNYAGIGMTYDSDRDAFIHDSPFPSWVLDEATFQWEAPSPPVAGYQWDEGTTSWVQPPQPFPSWTWEDDHWQFPGDPPDDLTKWYDWDEDTLSWVETERPG